MRYQDASDEKAGGVVYTPEALADFIASRLLEYVDRGANSEEHIALDPAVGDGALLAALGRACARESISLAAIMGRDVDADALASARARLGPGAILEEGDFLAAAQDLPRVDMIIANPPYVRAQILGAEATEDLRARFGLTGRVDLSHAFLLQVLASLSPRGVAAVITSNRFMTVKAGERVRAKLFEQARLFEIWDLGDTKLFDAAVLPVVLVFGRKREGEEVTELPRFTSAYSLDPAVLTGGDLPHAEDVFEALEHEGEVLLGEDRALLVRHGVLARGDSAGDIWRGVSEEEEAWLEALASGTWRTFGEVGKIKVGVKSCADRVFIATDWGDEDEAPELLRPLVTHHVARRFQCEAITRQILYPHTTDAQGKRARVTLDDYPLASAYLEEHRERLESRKYLIDAGRQWYELWVAHDPAAWDRPKLVWRDIVDSPTFWLDETGAVVNGDCYWMSAYEHVDDDVLWLALAVANSSTIARFYDLRFNNKLYAGRRRFITQYVKHFPLPDPDAQASVELVELARAAHADPETEVSQATLDGAVRYSHRTRPREAR